MLALKMGFIFDANTMPDTSDIRIRSVRPLISPAILEDELPLGAAGSTTI